MSIVIAKLGSTVGTTSNVASASLGDTRRFPSRMNASIAPKVQVPMGKSMELRPVRVATRGRFRTGAPPTAPCALPEQRPLVASHPAPSVEVERFPATQVQVTAKNVLPGRLWLMMEQQRVTSAPQAEPKVDPGKTNAPTALLASSPRSVVALVARIARATFTPSRLLLDATDAYRISITVL